VVTIGQYTTCLRPTITTSADEMRNELIRLQKHDLYSKYGDMLAEACNELQLQGESKKVEGWQSLVGKYWTQIGEQPKREMES
jgi:hypothetical protein